jgi:hypothetical protein
MKLMETIISHNYPGNKTSKKALSNPECAKKYKEEYEYDESMMQSKLNQI